MSYYLLALLALASSAVSITITKTKIFEWLRNSAEQEHALLGHLFSCAYCMSHWVTFGFMLWHDSDLSLKMFMTYWLALIGISAIISGTIMRLIPAFSTEVLDLQSQMEERNVLIKELTEALDSITKKKE